MEVHPPEHPIQTWRQFFIHIATIVVGLLIAIGLEQSVEALHRRHLLHQAEAKLHSELLANEQTLWSDRKETAALRADVESNIAAMQAAATQAPYAGVQHTHWNWSGINSTAWDTARDSGAIVLMPYDAAQAQDELYRQAQLVNVQASVVLRDIFASAGALPDGRKLSDQKPRELEMAITASRQLLVDLNYLDMLTGNLDHMYRSRDAGM